MIMVNNSVTFVHIPKNAGTSIKKWFKNNFLERNINTFSGKEHKTHSNIPEVLENNNLKKENLGFTFCIIRNPWDRAVSDYFYLKWRIPNTIHKEKHRFSKKQQKNNFKLFKLLNKTENFNEFTKEFYKTDYGEMNKFPQLHWSKDCDYTIKFENLHEGFKKIQQKLNCYSFPSTSNQSNRNNDYRSYYNTESINIIADFYKDDIKQYNYKF